MGTRGRIGQTDNVRYLRGNPGHRKGKKSVKAPPGAPTCPMWLDGEAKAEWKRIVPALDKLGILAKVDRAALSAYCDAWSKFTRAARELEDLTRRDSNGNTGKHPLWQIYREASGLVAQWGTQIGVTPATRLRMTLPEPPDDEDEGADILD